MQIPLEHTKTVQEFPDPSFRALVMQYIQRCGKGRVWVRDYVCVCVCARVCVHARVCVCSCLATKVFIGNLLARAPQLMSCNYTVCVCVCVFSEIKLQLFSQKSMYPHKQPGYSQGGYCESQGAAA